MTFALTLAPSIIIFVMLSGFWAMIDTAILSVTPAEVEVMFQRKRWGARQLKILTKHMTRAIIVIVIFANITNVLGPILIGARALELYGSRIIGVITAVLTLSTILCAEIIPKAIGAHYAPRISRYSAPALLLFVFLLYPLVRSLEMCTHLFRRGAKRKVGTEDQIKALASIGGGAGHIQADESELIHRAFLLNDRKAQDIMTPVDKIVAMPADRSIRLAAKIVFRSVFSRYPIYGDSIHDIRGYALSRDILSALADGHDKAPVSDVMRPLLAVVHTMPSNALLELFRTKQTQFAVVKDHKKTVGLVTLEDVLEELVGEIEDEGDAE